MSDFSRYMEMIRGSQTGALIILIFSVLLFSGIVLVTLRISKSYRIKMKNLPLSEDDSEKDKTE